MVIKSSSGRRLRNFYHYGNDGLLLVVQFSYASKLQIVGLPLTVHVCKFCNSMSYVIYNPIMSLTEFDHILRDHILRVKTRLRN